MRNGCFDHGPSPGAARTLAIWLWYTTICCCGQHWPKYKTLTWHSYRTPLFGHRARTDRTNTVSSTHLTFQERDYNSLSRRCNTTLLRAGCALHGMWQLPGVLGGRLPGHATHRGSKVLKRQLYRVPTGGYCFIRPSPAPPETLASFRTPISRMLKRIRTARKSYMLRLLLVRAKCQSAGADCHCFARLIYTTQSSVSNSDAGLSCM